MGFFFFFSPLIIEVNIISGNTRFGCRTFFYGLYILVQIKRISCFSSCSSSLLVRGRDFPDIEVEYKLRDVIFMLESRENCLYAFSSIHYKVQIHAVITCICHCSR